MFIGQIVMSSHGEMVKQYLHEFLLRKDLFEKICKQGKEYLLMLTCNLCGKFQ